MCKSKGNSISKSGLFPKEYLGEIEDDLNSYLEKEIEKLKQENKCLKLAISFR